MHQYDRILREWMLDEELSEAKFRKNYLVVFHDIDQLFLRLRDSEWKSDGVTDELEITIERFEQLDQLNRDLKLIYELSIEHLNSESHQGEILDKQKEVRQAVEQFKAVAQFCRQFRTQVMSGLSLKSPAGSLRKIETEFSRITKGHEQRFARLLARIQEELNAKRERKQTLQRLSDELRRIGADDLAPNQGEVENRPGTAEGLILEIKSEDANNLYNWKEVLSYKKLGDAEQILACIEKENQYIGEIKRDLDIVAETIDSFRPCGGVFTQEMDRANFDKARAEFSQHYGFIDQENLDIADLLRQETMDNQFVDFVKQYCLEKESTIINHLIEAYRIILKYQKSPDETIESGYIDSLLEKVAAQQDKLDEKIQIMLDEFQKLTSKKSQWNAQTDLLSAFEDDYAMNLQGGLWRLLRKSYFDTQRAIAIDNIRQVLSQMDRIAPDNTFTLNIKERYGI